MRSTFLLIHKSTVAYTQVGVFCYKTILSRVSRLCT